MAAKKKNKKARQSLMNKLKPFNVVIKVARMKELSDDRAQVLTHIKEIYALTKEMSFLDLKYMKELMVQKGREDSGHENDFICEVLTDVVAAWE